MGFRIDEFVAWSPYLYHVTRAENLAYLSSTRILLSAAELLARGKKGDQVRIRRDADLDVVIDGHPVVLRDQARLVLGSLDLPEEVSVEDYVEYLNRWVFLWPGEPSGPRGRARGLIAADNAANVALLRFRTRDLLAENPGITLQFCDCNSGAARHHSGNKAKRHLRMHRTAGLFRGGLADVIEVAVVGRVPIPGSAEVGRAIGRWQDI